MIPISKGETPKILAEKGQALVAQMKIAYTNGQRKFDFDSAVYGGKTVKDLLINAQHNKCCFCESSLHAQHGDVEHFRPKGAWKQTDKDSLSEVGYYWLAYEWDNLYLACQKCNQMFKKNFFPLENPHQRAFDHTFDVSNEVYLIINPGIDNPQEHLVFKKEVIVAKTRKGEETISRTAIDQSTFEEDRSNYYKAVDALIKCLKLFNENQLTSPDGNEIVSTIFEIVAPKKPYYAMLRDNFKTQLETFGIVIM